MYRTVSKNPAGAVMLVITICLLFLSGCRQNKEFILKKITSELHLGMTRAEVEVKLGRLGKREYLCEERTKKMCWWKGPAGSEFYAYAGCGDERLLAKMKSFSLDPATVENTPVSRDHYVSYRKDRILYTDPPDILETFPLEDDSTTLVHYAFAREFLFATGCDCLGLTLFYETKTGRLIGIFLYRGHVLNHPDLDFRCRDLDTHEIFWFQDPAGK